MRLMLEHKTNTQIKLNRNTERNTHCESRARVRARATEIEHEKTMNIDELKRARVESQSI